MIAIRLTKRNLHKILNASPIDQRDLEAMIEEYDTPHLANALFFVPQSSVDVELSRVSWMTYSRHALNEQFDYDKSKIEDQFVTLNPKPTKKKL